ncbi:ABC transporter permease [Kineococcus rubinsiae]|uniref:ABC transporter permease n=1 Tax=Kineococcus rubinsiae TaxID=2609562 RepID=UPI001431CA6F|nr:ABC transporter permease [Kineococcus rubinsiae]NIZ89516.1 ABC transporter permease [Kineococcus rubinsiae]
MSAVVAVPTRPASALRGYRFELLKLTAQWRTRVLLLVCAVGPAVFVAAVSRQSTLPTDTVFGRWMGQTGWAGSLVVLSFCCSWILPLLTSLVAGDAFAVEDRLGTWRHLVTVVRSPGRLFATKALAAATVLAVLAVALAASSLVGGLLAVGSHELVGLDGHLLTPGQAAGTVLLAWAVVLAPTCAFAAVGLLGSVALGRSPTGLLLPALLALLLQLVQLLPLPVAVRVALPGSAFLAWRGLFTTPAQTTPLLLGVGVGLVWAVAATALARHLFVRRDFTDVASDGLGGRVLLRVVLPLAALFAVTVAGVAVAAPASGAGIGREQLQTSLATSYAHLYRLQTRELARPDVTEAQLRTSATCDKGGGLVADTGPGNDWRCVVSWHIPGATAVGSAVYQLDVTADGRYVADGDGPQAVNGFFQVRTPTGDAPNPIWQFDGLVDLLAPTTKG